MNILLVDDSSVSRLLLKNVIEDHLNKSGVRFIDAANGKIALEMLLNHDIHLMFLDWNMPVMDGEVLLNHIRKDKTLDSVKIIIASAEGSKDKVIEMIKKGIDGYLVKPFDKKSILMTFQRVVEKIH